MNDYINIKLNKEDAIELLMILKQNYSNQSKERKEFIINRIIYKLDFLLFCYMKENEEL